VGIYKDRVHVCGCVYFRIDTQSSHVGMYIFSYIRNEFMFLFIYLRTYTQSFHVCVSVHMYITRRLRFGGYIFVYVHRVWVVVYVVTYILTEFVCVCVHIRIGTRSLYVLVCICLRICSQSLHGYVYTQNDSQCVYTCVGYGLKCKCEQV